MKYLFLFFISLPALAAPYHCSPNPPDGQYYIDAPNIKYESGIPKECLSVMKDDGTVIPHRFLKFDEQLNKFVVDEDKAALEIAADNTKKAERALEVSRIKTLARKETLTAADIKEALQIILKRNEKE